MIILVVVAIISLVFILGALLAFIFSRADKAVINTKTAIVAEEKSFNPGMTLGFRIKPTADPAAQMEQARREAAKLAAAMPRGANSRVGASVTSNVTASKALKEDPITALKIAQYHGWDGARSGIPAGGVPAAVAGAVAAAPVAAAAAGPAEVTVVAGRDYVEIPITDGMSPEEVRKARAANAKARSAAMKAAKASQSGVVEAAAPVAAAAAGAVAAAPAAVPSAVAGIEPPSLIEITDAMSPEDIRKARVANSKAMAAYNKALKAAGGVPGQVAEAAAPVAEAAVAAVAAAPAAVSAVATSIERPSLIEITEAMSPEDIRKARVANSKAMAAYNKALKAAGIDPASVA